MSRRGLLILALSGALQLVVATLPDTMADLLLYRTWARTLAREGLEAAYWPTSPTQDGFAPAVDYPPLFPYALWAVGKGLAVFSPEALERDRLLDFLIRVPLVVSVLLLAALVCLETRRRAPAAADLALGLVALSPALVFDSAYWGQADAPCALLVAAALVALVHGRPGWAWAAISAGAMLKPLALPFAPLLALETLKRFGPVATLRCAGVAAGTLALLLAPFAWIGRGGDALRALVAQVDAMPFASVNGHNLPWLLSGGLPWTRADAPALGPLSYRALSLSLLGGFYLLALVRLWRSRDPRALYLAAALSAVGFFVLSTHMHENHLVGALPALALAGLHERRVRRLYLIATATTLLNMALHDPYLTHVLRPHVPGPQLALPQQADVPEALLAGLRRQGYPWVADEITGRTSLLGVLATLLDAQANVLLLAWMWLVAGRGGGFDGTLADRELPSAPVFLAGAALFVTVTGAFFLARALVACASC